MKGVEIVEGQAYFSGSTAELQRALAAGELDACGSLVVEGKLNALPPEIGRLTRLRELVLDTDTLQTIDPAIFACAGLVKLVVHSNQIKELPAGGWGRLARLEQLEFAGAKALRGLPEDLGAAALLGGAFDLLPQTKLTALPRSFGRLSRVTLLRLPPGVAAPDPIAGMTGLRELRVRAVATLPEDLGALQELRFVDACECPITRLPASIGGASALRSLSLGRTLVTTLPDSVCERAGAARSGSAADAADGAAGGDRAGAADAAALAADGDRAPAGEPGDAGGRPADLPAARSAGGDRGELGGVLAALGERVVFE
ncbi:MAG: leucine-rich repeat domain-containing protein [Nannocystis sp.]|uniref:leucine-rich repeat domain-containing protein n=1 Tax=Nannocystis sp. TaxID=1962667 RepID=UPI002429F578|nr:hypothetical protein [Nannocystis sp.]MBK9753733.1 leucine-rich repeat domain-containing protein [Nannocystis sp.]